MSKGSARTEEFAGSGRSEFRGRTLHEPLHVLGVASETVILRLLYWDNRRTAPLVDFRVTIGESKTTSAIVITCRQIDKP